MMSKDCQNIATMCRVQYIYIEDFVGINERPSNLFFWKLSSAQQTIYLPSGLKENYIQNGDFHQYSHKYLFLATRLDLWHCYVTYLTTFNILYNQCNITYFILPM